MKTSYIQDVKTSHYAIRLLKSAIAIDRPLIQLAHGKLHHTLILNLILYSDVCNKKTAVAKSPSTRRGMHAQRLKIEIISGAHYELFYQSLSSSESTA